MKENILTDVFTLVEIVRRCRQHFEDWVEFHALTDEHSMHFSAKSYDAFRLLILDIHQALNRSQSDKFTFWRIFTRQESKDYEENAITPVNINYWKKLLNKHDTTIVKIKKIRDTQIVHTDRDVPPPGFISMAELQMLLHQITIIILEMLSILGLQITNIATIGEYYNHSLADAFKLMELNRQQKLLSARLRLK